MPIKPLETIKTTQFPSSVNDSAVQALNYLEDTTSEAIKVDERDRGLVESLINYLHAVRTLTSGTHTEEEKAAAHETLDGFKAFMEGKEEGEEKSNYRRLRESKLGPVFDSYVWLAINEADAWLGTGIDFGKLENEDRVENLDEILEARDEEDEEYAGLQENVLGVEYPEKENFQDLDDSSSDDSRSEIYLDPDMRIRTAEDMIDYYKRKPGITSWDVKAEDMTLEQREKALDAFIYVMAVRNGADAVRNNKTNLRNTSAEKIDIDKETNKLWSNPEFQGFLDALRQDPQKMNAALKAANANPGHCGGLDDMFKTYLKQSEPGRMPNNSVLRRYLPTVKERIEYLQKRAKADVKAAQNLKKVNDRLDVLKAKNNPTEKDLQKIEELSGQKLRLDTQLASGNLARCAAEILVLRNSIHAVRKDESTLNRRVRCNEEEDTLSKETLRLAKDRNFVKYLNKDPRTAELLLEGHGGRFIEKLREKEEAGKFSGTLTDTLQETTIRKRMADLKDRAKRYAERLDDAEPGQNMNPTVKDAHRLIREYIYLDSLTREGKSDPNTGRLAPVSETKLDRDLPWNEVDRMEEENALENSDYVKFVGEMNPKQLSGALKDLSGKSFTEFVTNLGKRNDRIRRDSLEEIKDFEYEAPNDGVEKENVSGPSI